MQSSSKAEDRCAVQMRASSQQVSTCGRCGCSKRFRREGVHLVDQRRAAVEPRWSASRAGGGRQGQAARSALSATASSAAGSSSRKPPIRSLMDRDGNVVLSGPHAMVVARWFLKTWLLLAHPEAQDGTPRSPLRAGALARTTSTAWMVTNSHLHGAVHLGHQASREGAGNRCDPAHPAPHGDRGRQGDPVQSQARRRAVPRREPRVPPGLGDRAPAGGRGPSPAPVAASGKHRGDFASSTFTARTWAG